MREKYFTDEELLKMKKMGSARVGDNPDVVLEEIDALLEEHGLEIVISDDDGCDCFDFCIEKRK